MLITSCFILWTSQIVRDRCTMSLHEDRSHTYILLTKHEGPTGRTSARGLDSSTKKTKADILPGWSRASLVNKRFIIRLKFLNPNDRLQRHHKLQARNFHLEQTERLSRLTISKRKTKLEENKNNILCRVTTFRKKRSTTTGKSSCGIIRDSAQSNT